MTDKDKKKDKDKKNRRQYAVPIILALGTLAVSKVSFASSVT